MRLIPLCSSSSVEALILPPRLRGLLGSRMPSSKLAKSPQLLKRLLGHERIVVVGDYTSNLLRSIGVNPWVIVRDCTVERHLVSCPSPPEGYEVVRVENRRSTVSCKAAQAVCMAVKMGRIVVEVEGEEDLLALPAILCSDFGTVVVYGLPRKGSVVARVTPAAKRLAFSALREFTPLA